MRLRQKLSIFLFFVFFVGLYVSAQSNNPAVNSAYAKATSKTYEKDVGPIVVKWTPSDSIPESLVFVEIEIYSQVIASNNLTAYNPSLSWDSTSIGAAFTSGEVYAIMPSGTNIAMIYAKFIKWKTFQEEEQSIENMQLGTWSVN